MPAGKKRLAEGLQLGHREWWGQWHTARPGPPGVDLEQHGLVIPPGTPEGSQHAIPLQPCPDHR